jgi:nucleoside-diphosphate-sugar epimerase
MIPSSNHHQNYNHVLMDLSSHEIKIDPSIQVKRIYHLASIVKNGDTTESVLYHKNIDSAKTVLEFARKRNAHLIFTSSNSIFDFVSPNPLSELVHPNPLDGYGKSKLFVESFLRNTYGTKSLVLRLPIVMGEGRAGFFSIIFEIVKNDLPIVLPKKSAVMEFVENDYVVDLLIRSAKDEVTGVHNIGTNKVFELNDMIKSLVGAVHSKSTLIYIPNCSYVFILKVLGFLKFSPFGSFQIKSLTKGMYMTVSEIQKKYSLDIVEPFNLILGSYRKYLTQSNDESGLSINRSRTRLPLSNFLKLFNNVLNFIRHFLKRQ